MKGCARTCLLQLLGWAIASFAFFYYFQSLAYRGAPTIWVSVAAGLCVMIAIGYAWAIKDLAIERQMLLDAAVGAPPADGQWCAVSGRIQALDPLRGPLSGADVVAYQYKITNMERSGRSTSEVTYYEGKGLTPSTIATRHGSIRLLAVPMFDVDAADLGRYIETIERARAYAASTPFSAPKESRDAMDREMTDDDGNYRFDKQWHPEHIPDMDGFRFEEKHVQQGETVCVFGLYSQQRGGIVPHPNWAKHTRIMRGDAAAVARQIRKRITRYVIGIAVFSAAAYAIARLYAANV